MFTQVQVTSFKRFQTENRTTASHKELQIDLKATLFNMLKY